MLRYRQALRVGFELVTGSGLLTANQKLRRRAIEAHFAHAIDELYLAAGAAHEGGRA